MQVQAIINKKEKISQVLPNNVGERRNEYIWSTIAGLVFEFSDPLGVFYTAERRNKKNTNVVQIAQPAANGAPPENWFLFVDKSLGSL